MTHTTPAFSLSAPTDAKSPTTATPRRTFTGTFDRLSHVTSAGGFSIPKIDLICEATVPNIDAAKFAEIADGAKTNCPVSKVLAAAEITLDAKLV